MSHAIPSVQHPAGYPRLVSGWLTDSLCVLYRPKAGHARHGPSGNLTSDGVRSYSYDHANRLTQVTEGSLTTQFGYNGDGVRTSKTVAGDTAEYVLDLMATLPVVISDSEAEYL